MKKTTSILSTALLSTFASCALAGQVTLFGAVDLGVKVQKSKGHDTVVSLDSGTYAGSRWGLTGREEINSDLSVSFLLESGFDADTGASKGKLFNRGSLLRLESKTFGTLAFGRTSAFTSASGEYGWMWQVDPFKVLTWTPAYKLPNLICGAGAIMSSYICLLRLLIGKSAFNTL